MASKLICNAAVDIWRQIIPEPGKAIDMKVVRDEISKVDASKYRFVEMDLPLESGVKAEIVYVGEVPVRFLQTWDVVADRELHRADIYAQPIH